MADPDGLGAIQMGVIRGRATVALIDVIIQ